MLSGYKTYLVAGGIAVVTFVHTMGWIDDQTFATLLGLLNAGGLAALRAGVKKAEV